MKAKFLETIQKYRMFDKGHNVFVGVSGGPDSVALFHMIYSLKNDLGLKNVGIFHVNHLLRDEESEKDQIYVENLAKQFQVPISIGRVNVRELQRNYHYSQEEAARIGRFHYMRDEAKRQGIDRVALGHTQDDQAETVLMRIIRGTGLRGFQAIRPVLNYPETTFVRPLIEIRKDECIDYLKLEKLSYRIDASNYSTRYVRNRIRIELLPELEKNYNPRIKEILARLPEAIGMDISFLDEITDQQYERSVKRVEDDEIFLEKEVLAELPEAIQYRIFNKAISILDPNVELDFYHWNEIRKAMNDQTHFQISLPEDMVITFERKEVLITKKLTEPVIPYEYHMKLGERIYVKEAQVNFSCEVFDKRIYKVKKDDRRYEIFDYDKLKFPLSVRNRRPGDVFQPMGMSGKKKLKDFLIDRKVPSREKIYLPLFVSGGKIVWVFGLGISGDVAVTDRTRKFLKISSFEQQRSFAS
ncbi:MAG: tRNA lysidine(34) synthetase TilS [Candidatus Omnitrophica bacterium]|nr:tRNA lysidine(34) synthetase TilS [Candidatus Omnitrophota bacterium]